MSVKYGKYEMPDRIKLDEASHTSTYAKFIVEPFERGAGHTIGNALRRFMLTSLEAPSILSVRIEGIQHEYMAVEGIVQDMTHIILNLKGSLLRRHTGEGEYDPRQIHSVTKVLDITDEMIEKGRGEYRVTLKDMLGPCDFELINPEHHIFTVTKPMTRKIDLKIGMGRGYVPSERHVFERGVDEIVIDSSFSPVRLVNYYVENTRVGQDTDFDRLIFEITTDGRVSPSEALSFAAQIGIHHFQVFEKVQAHSIMFDQGEININRDRDEVLQKLALKINEIELSVRSTNCLENAKIEFIGELVLMKEDEMLRFRNFGKKSLTEIRQKLEELELSLGMDLSRYGINQENVRSIILQYLQDKAGALEVKTGNVEL